jgi:hypothetical protein
MKVFTTQGLIEFDELDVKDIVEMGDNYRKIATEWRYQGELVRRDVAVSALRPLQTETVEGKLGG